MQLGTGKHACVAAWLVPPLVTVQRSLLHNLQATSKHEGET